MPTTAHILGAIYGFYHSPMTVEHARTAYDANQRLLAPAPKQRGRRKALEPQFSTLSNEVSNSLKAFLDGTGPALQAQPVAAQRVGVSDPQPMYIDIMEKFIFSGLEYDERYKGNYHVIIE